MDPQKVIWTQRKEDKYAPEKQTKEAFFDNKVMAVVKQNGPAEGGIVECFFEKG